MKATARYLKVTPQKLRLVADAIRGKNAEQASVSLKFLPKRSARMMNKVLAAAINNASQSGDIDTGNLFVKTVCVDEGPTMKRWLPRARGSATKIMKRTSHVQLVLEER